MVSKSRICTATPAATPAGPNLCLRPAATPPRIALAPNGGAMEIPDLGHALVACTPGGLAVPLCVVTPTPGVPQAALGQSGSALAFDALRDLERCAPDASAWLCVLP